MTNGEHKWKWKLLSRVYLFVTPWALQSIEFSRPEYWSGFSSVQFSCLVMSNSLRPREPQHARPPCPSPTARAYLNPCPLSWWCHPTISSSVIPFSSCPQSFPASGTWLFKWVSSSHQVAKGLEFQLQYQSFQWITRTISFRMD